MYLGRIVEEAPTERLFSHARHPYTQALLAAIPEADPRVRSRPQRLQGDLPSPLDPPSGCAFHERCPVAVERCRSERPPLRPISTGHLAACHLVEPDAA
jgi:oligopeptide/dipeptide ABC transporter ATP-binding protein